MKISLSLYFLPCAFGATLRGDSLKLQFQNWMQQFGKEYETAEEFLQRLEIWTQNHCTCHTNAIFSWSEAA